MTLNRSHLLWSPETTCRACLIPSLGGICASEAAGCQASCSVQGVQEQRTGVQSWKRARHYRRWCDLSWGPGKRILVELSLNFYCIVICNNDVGWAEFLRTCCSVRMQVSFPQEVISLFQDKDRLLSSWLKHRWGHSKDWIDKQTL